jgi:Exonuclease VII, large subunit
MTHPQEISLFQLNAIVKEAVKTCFPERYWVRAELSEARESGPGHCYVEFVEKDSRGGQMIAKARGSIWANRWRLLKPYFEETTGQRFVAGIKVLVEVSVEFHELYGYSLVVNDIDPSYTMGDMARNRAEILKRLTDEGVRDMNKELEMPLLPNRIAVISSSTAAGLGDFMNQLEHNEAGYPFYTHLFPAVMQGSQTEKSVIQALDNIFRYQHLFDVVVIIRGGGATSDLNSFDSYPLAQNCAQFPLPLIVGIGHERDETVLDSIAHTRVKTPTAAAEFLISRMDEANQHLYDLHYAINENVRACLERESKKLTMLTERIPQLATGILSSNRMKLDFLTERIRTALPMQIERARRELQNMEKIIELTSPENILKKGYSLTLINGKVVRDASQLKRGDRVTTLYERGSSESLVTDLTYESDK